MTNRRTFLSSLPAGAALLGFGTASAAAPILSEADPTAIALGYRSDAGKVDAKKYQAYVPGRRCADCQLYAGKTTDANGACSAFGGKIVSAKGWCMAWVKKA